MTNIDHQLNRLIETLRQFGVGDDTWICFTSDHGELMGDHDLFRKGLPYEGSAGVPLLLAPPTGVEWPRGSTSDALVELRDIMPTLLDCAGIQPPDGIDGVSALPSVFDPGIDMRPWLHGEHVLLGQTIQWLTDGHLKYVWWSGTGHEQLFDLDNDPQERHDLAEDPGWQDVLQTWRGRLVEILAGREDGLSDGATLQAGRPVSTVLPSVIECWSRAADA